MPATPFLVVGENIHATRVLKRTGKPRGRARPTARVGIGFDDARRRPARPPGPPGRSPPPATSRPARSSTSPERDPLGPRRRRPAPTRPPPTSAPWPHARRRPARTGWTSTPTRSSADSGHARAGAWPGWSTTVEATATRARVDRLVRRGGARGGRRGLRASRAGRLLLNSASIERPEVLDLAAAGRLRGDPRGQRRRRACPPTPRSASRNAIALIELAIAAAIPAETCSTWTRSSCPVAVEPDAPGPRPRGGPPAPRGVRRRDPPDRRPVQRLVRHAGAAAAQRHVHRPARPRPASTAGSSTPWRRTSRGCSPRTATARPTGSPRTCCWAATRSAASTWLAFREGRLGAE